MKIIQILLYYGLLGLMLTTVATENEVEEQEKAPTAKATKTEKSKAVRTGDHIYTWIDSSGNRIYSDVPRDGAEVMKIEEGTDYTPPESERDWSTMKPKVVATGEQYSHFEIASPANGATIRNNDGTFQVALDIRPKLGNGHKVKLELDGKQVSATGSSIFALNNVDRGSHTLVAHIMAANDKVLISTPPVTIHMHRAIKKVTPNK